MTTEWTELKTLQDVAKAQANDWEIEVDWNDAGEWRNWGKADWHDDAKYRARPRQPKMRKVRMLCWFTGSTLSWYPDSYKVEIKNWHRIPAQDIEIEIPEGV